MQALSPTDLAADELARRILKMAANNFVERPWGGTRLRELKGLCPLPDQVELTGSGLGESFEISAFDDDAEAARYPGKVLDARGASISLPALMKAHAEALVGEEWVRRYGRAIPLLPKFLNVRELLSVQGHPPGHTEAYVVVDAEPGATIRLGFRRSLDAGEFRRELGSGVTDQRELAARLGSDAPWISVQKVLAPWLAERQSNVDALLPVLATFCSDALTGDAVGRAASLLESLKRRYWYVLDAMNEIPLEPGQVIYNSNPPAVAAARGHAPAAEVHALGNPEQREFVMLEIRRPGPTFRAWDNVRFPLRNIDIDSALNVLNLEQTDPAGFISKRARLAGAGHTRSVDSPYFRIEHIEIGVGEYLDLNCDDAHCLHVLCGGVDLITESTTVRLLRGESAFVPIGVRAYRVLSLADGLHLVKVHLP